MQVVVPDTTAHPTTTGMSSRHLLLLHRVAPPPPASPSRSLISNKGPSGSPYLAGDPYLLEYFSPPKFISRACSIKQITSDAVFLIIYGDLVLRIDFIRLGR